MNFNANAANQPSTKRKIKRVNDTYSMGYNPYENSIPQPQQNFYPNLPPENMSTPLTNDAQFVGQQFTPKMPTGQPFTPVPFMNNVGIPADNFGVFKQPIVQDFAMQYGQQIAATGTTMIKEEVNRYISIKSLKYYFAVNNQYVLKKLILLFLPFTHSDWTIKYQDDFPIQPRYEINAPDLYIPTMAYITYILTASLMLGIQKRFSSESIGMIASSTLAWWVFELVVYKFILYVSSVQTQLRTFDLMAYSGYKFVGIISSLFASLIMSKMGYYACLMYSSFMLVFFLVRSLKLQVLGDGPQAGYYGGGAPMGRKRRINFLLFIALVQPFLSWWLSFQLAGESIFKLGF